MRSPTFAPPAVLLGALVIATFAIPTLESRAAEQELEKNEAMLLMKAGAFDPLAGSPEISNALSWKPGPGDQHDYFIVQLKNRSTSQARAALIGAGAELFDYVPHNAHIVRTLPDSIEAIEELRVVRAVTPYHPAFRVDPAALLLQGDESRTWAVTLFEVEDVVPAIEAIAAVGAEVTDVAEATRLTVKASPSQLPALAAITDLYWIQEEPTLTRRNDSATWVVQSNVSGSTTVWNKGLRGEGQIVGHIDEPLDLNNCYFRDPSVGSAGPSHRKVIVHNGGTATWGDHGEHTAATAAGDQQPINGSTFRNGIAYKAKIAHTNDSLISGSNLNSRLTALFNSGARDLTNSWGNDSTTAYDSWARDIDVFSHNHEDALVMWAVTNLSSLKNPENAKNCLAVGATNKANGQHNHCTGGTGPTNDGRRKPEVYAPGCNTQSANSGTSCSTQSMSGTSMASPAVCGAATLVRQYFAEGYYPSGVATVGDQFAPTGSLVKAVVVNTSVNMTGVGGYPSNKEGWGRVLLENSLYFSGDSHGLYVEDVRMANGITSVGETRTYTFDVQSASKPLEITLAYHDSPGSLGTSFAAVNNLDLKVTAPGGAVYRGNVFSSAQSSSGGTFDNKNNIERVRRNSPSTGTWTVEIIGANVPAPAQGFAIAVSGDIATCPPGVTYGNGELCSKGTVASIGTGGAPSVGNPGFALTLTGGNTNSTCVVFAGDSVGNNQQGWGTILVAGPNFTRTWTSTDVLGAASVAVPITAGMVGTTRFFQYAVRDPGFGGNVQASDGIQVTFCP